MALRVRTAAACTLMLGLVAGQAAAQGGWNPNKVDGYYCEYALPEKATAPLPPSCSPPTISPEPRFLLF